MDSDLNIDWKSGESHLLLSPYINNSLELNDLPHLPGHIWLMSSGTTSLASPKIIAISKQSFLVSAQSVNEHIDLVSDDVIFNSLPTFHVGGLSVYARASLAGAQVVQSHDKWDVVNFVECLQNCNATVASVVPTQVYDLIQKNLKSPASMRCLFVGGGHLEQSLYLKGVELGWPILKTYGMTEMASQVATAPMSQVGLAEQKLVCLPHVDVSTDDRGCAVIAGKSLATGYAIYESGNIQYAEYDKALVTNDLVHLTGSELQMLGRCDHIRKINGELVSLQDLDSALIDFKSWGEYKFLFAKDERSENKVVLALELSLMNQENKILQACESMGGLVSPKAIYYVDQIPKSELGKIKVGQLKERLGL